MGSPFRYRYREPARGFDVINQLLGLHAPRTEWPEEERSLPPLPVPATSIYSRLDGIVDWRTCIAPLMIDMKTFGCTRVTWVWVTTRP